MNYKDLNLLNEDQPLILKNEVKMSVCLCVRVFVYLFTFDVPFNSLFAPTSGNWMSNIFRDSESGY